MKLIQSLRLLILGSLLSLSLAAQETVVETPAALFQRAIFQLAGAIEPGPDAEARTLSATITVSEASTTADEFLGRRVEFALQAPDRMRVAAEIEGRQLRFGRRGDEIWLHAPVSNFAVRARQGVARFQSRPEELDQTSIGPLELPFEKSQLALVPFLVEVEALAPEIVRGEACHQLRATPREGADSTLGIGNGELRLWLRESDLLPTRIAFDDGDDLSVTVELEGIALSEPWADERWQLDAPGAEVEEVALSHITRFLPVLLSILTNEIPTLPEATGSRQVVATSGRGKLMDFDGTRVLLMAGSPEEMGRQHGLLLRDRIHDLVDHILYGVGVGSSFEKGRWFFGEIEEAQSRLLPFMNERYLREIDAMADAAGLDREEGRLANFFPELFHCSGYALFGEATSGGTLYHGRILDYLKGIGLEQCATVQVLAPEGRHAWVNIGYAGFVGSVTAMNEKKVAIGEMGGRGEGDWDGTPMAHLVREVMEEADDIDEAIEIMRSAPRTCVYYYVITDGKTKRAVGIAATPNTFDVVWPGETHPQLPHGVPDTVIFSAGQRYEDLVKRVRKGYGDFEARTARDLMRRPVAMSSNIHSVLFAPETLDFWVANADSENVASHTRYTHYNLTDLLGLIAPEGEEVALRSE